MNRIFSILLLIFSALFHHPGLFAQAPVAAFSLSANAACTNSLNAIQITDLSSNNPTSWSYTVAIQGPGPGGVQVFSSQNPTVTFNFQGTYTITSIAANASGTSAPSSQTISVRLSPDAVIIPSGLLSCIGASPVTIGLFPTGPGAGSYSYLWSVGASGSSITVSPALTTTYACIITATNGCTTTKTATITVGQPTVNITSNPVNICPGSSATLTAFITGPGPYACQWSTGATSNSIITASPAAYNATVSNGLGCTGVQTYTLGTSSTLSLTAVAVPTAICLGNNGLLQVTGAASYSWNNGATSANVVVNPVVPTVYTVTGLAGNCTGTATVLLNVGTTPSIAATANPGSVCLGNTLAISATGAGSYTWFPGAVVAAGFTIAPGVNSTFTVRGQNPGCAPRMATLAVNVIPNPTVSIATASNVICIGESVELSANGANSWLWDNGSISPVLVVSPTLTTVYTVTGTANSCTQVATITQNVAVCTGIPETGDQAWLIYPSPASDVLFIKAPAGRIRIRVMNASAQVLRDLTVVAPGHFCVDIGDLENGLYFLSVEHEGDIYRHKRFLKKS